MKQVVFRPFIIISASQQGLTVNENHNRTMAAQEILLKNGADFANVTEVVDGVAEKSFMIFGEKAVNLGSTLCDLLGQSNYIVRDQVNEGYLVDRQGTRELLGTPKEIEDIDKFSSYVILPQLDGAAKKFTFVKEH